MLLYCKRLLSELRKKNHGAPRLWFIGPMPPPIHGQSLYNTVLLDFLRSYRSPTCLPLGGTRSEKLAGALLLPLVMLFVARRKDDIYTSPPGQGGVWTFLILLATLRIRHLDHFVHHHSFRAINQAPALSAKLLAQIGGRYQRHIFLSDGMRERYAKLYLNEHQRSRSLVLPNSFLFYDPVDHMPQRSGPITLGHLSVITREKGIVYLMDLAERMMRVRSDFRLLLAGPVRDASLKEEILAFCARTSDRAVYLGPVYGDQKADFYRAVDIFVLPSRLLDEADPLVLLESYSNGCEVVASSTGCIPERIRSADQLLSFTSDNDCALVGRIVDQCKADRSGVSSSCVAHAQRLYANSREAAIRFLGALSISIPLDAFPNKSGQAEKP
ncbi:glycosyltransferase family 4 protein [Bradyrhizobium monzae]|uniref:glycosyltransferase family 4 protein n=1 Tax=Bradyrhizobium sp. Oc8 TaxID=2876780 RepID=UPI001F32963A|nr:glycosyltransferase family 4 protein [Bradyrhizobium sp. Oc8]